MMAFRHCADVRRALDDTCKHRKDKNQKYEGNRSASAKHLKYSGWMFARRSILTGMAPVARILTGSEVTARARGENGELPYGPQAAPIAAPPQPRAGQTLTGVTGCLPDRIRSGIVMELLSQTSSIVRLAE